MSSNNNLKTGRPLLFAHIGDLHITKPKEQNYIDFMSIVSQLEIQCSDKLDFVVLPGDNADNGLPEQYRLVGTALKMLSVPVHIIPGDHDMEQGNLQGFYSLPGAKKLPWSVVVNNINCLFLDVCGPGKGGPDFRLGDEQLLWLKNEFARSEETNRESIIFVHSYPDDLKDEQEKIAFNRLIAENKVALVDMGHTHYNELANDGDTIFSATRSTGQIEEGPVGYSLVAIDKGVVSWRFKPLDDPFPFVLITSPADYRLKRAANFIADGPVEVRAVVFGARSLQSVSCKIADGAWIPMFQNNGESVWKGTITIAGGPELAELTVKATDETGRPAQHTLEIATPLYKPGKRAKNGSDADAIGAWPENGISGTQLGPNRNSKPS